MLNAILRKARQLTADPVLRRWMLGRVLGRWPGEPAFKAHSPPYLEGRLPLKAETPSGDFAELPDDRPTGPLELSLAGETLRLVPGDEEKLFERRFDDVETTLALHRFAWLAALGDSADTAWVTAIWRAWLKNHAIPADGWAWHPYTAAERGINILAFAQRNGLPGPLAKTLSVLAQHGPAIAERLEYFGDHHTSNHLANNGRGLFLLGLTLGLPKCAEIGGRILMEEAKRIFSPSGVLREGSSHYHALLAVNYEQCAQAAAAIDRPEAPVLTDVARRARAVAGCLKLPGGFPLIGDISPDVPPEAVLDALAITENKGADALAEDGWHRLDTGPWSGLWHASPEGFSHMPGHGHQDCGGFELHFNGDAVVIDPGRGAYGETGEAAYYRSGLAHSTLLVDGADPYPANRPYYDAAFRSYIGGPPPRINKGAASIDLSHDGFRRLKGIGTVSRRWEFTDQTFSLADNVEGRGRHRVTRILVTPLSVTADQNGLVLRGREQAFRLTSDGDLSLEETTQWTAYGRGRPATAIRVTTDADLPWNGVMTLETL